MSIVARRAGRCELWRITWRPETLSASFHGRDLFAPVAALLAQGGLDAAADKLSSVSVAEVEHPPWPVQHAAIITFDRYGNAITGLDVSAVDPRAKITCAGHLISAAATFGAVPEGQAFWYGNSSGLVEIAVNQGNARQMLNLQAGMALRTEPKTSP
jgi:S-adenosylmethionine hydrolase